MRAAGLVVMLATATGCYDVYTPGSFTDQLGQISGPRAVIGCLEVAVARYPQRVVATADHDPVAVLIELGFGDRCLTTVTVDLGSVRVVARTREGAPIELTAVDLFGEIVPKPLLARTAGREIIDYASDTRVYPQVTFDPHSVCVDVGRLDASEHGERWLCLDAGT